MTESREHIDGMLQLLAQDAISEIALAVQDVACEFITSGGYGSLRMHMANNEKITEIFRSTANLMATQARRYAGGNGVAVADLVEAHLFSLIDRAIEERTNHIATGKIASQDIAILCADLRRDLRRLKNAAVRDLHNFLSDMPIDATVNVVAASGSTTLRATGQNC